MVQTTNIGNLSTTIGTYSPLIEKETVIQTNSVLNHVHSYNMFMGPDFSSPIEIDISYHHYNAVESGSGIIFQLHYPCFYILTQNAFARLDNEFFIEFAATSARCISFSLGEGTTLKVGKERYDYILSLDNTYQIYFYCTDDSSSSPHFPLGAINYWYHAGLGPGNDAGARPENRIARIIPYIGTPAGTLLATVYKATYSVVSPIDVSTCDSAEKLYDVKAYIGKVE